MTAATLLAELHDAGIRLSVHGVGLRIEAKPGTLSADLRERLAAAKPELVALLQSNLRTRLLLLADAEGLPTVIAADLHADDVNACHGLPDATLRTYLRALQRSVHMDKGNVPESYTQAAHCDGCGPVWLWPESPPRVKACPWCFRRKAGRSIPRPGERPCAI